MATAVAGRPSRSARSWLKACYPALRRPLSRVSTISGAGSSTRGDNGFCWAALLTPQPIQRRSASTPMRRRLLGSVRMPPFLPGNWWRSRRSSSYWLRPSLWTPRSYCEITCRHLWPTLPPSRVFLRPMIGSTSTARSPTDPNIFRRTPLGTPSRLAQLATRYAASAKVVVLGGRQFHGNN